MIDKECSQFWIKLDENDPPIYKGQYLIFIPSNRSMFRYWIADYDERCKYNLRPQAGSYSGDNREDWIDRATHYIHLEDPDDHDVNEEE